MNAIIRIWKFASLDLVNELPSTISISIYAGKSIGSSYDSILAKEAYISQRYVSPSSVVGTLWFPEVRFLPWVYCVDRGGAVVEVSRGGHLQVGRIVHSLTLCPP